MGTHPKPNLLTVGAWSVPISLTKGPRGPGTPKTMQVGQGYSVENTNSPQTALTVCVYSSQGALKGQPCQAPMPPSCPLHTR